MNFRKFIPILLGFGFIVLAGFMNSPDLSTEEAEVQLTVGRASKETFWLRGIEGQDIEIKVKTKTWERKADPVTELWITAWSTYEGSKAKTKLKRFCAEADLYHELLVFRHFDKRNGLREIKVNVQLKLKEHDAFLSKD